MSEAMTDALSNLRDHVPTLPSAADARDAMRSHLSSLKDIDTSAVTDRLPGSRRKRMVAVTLGLCATAAALAALVRRRRTASLPTSPTMYTPPLPKP